MYTAYDLSGYETSMKGQALNGFLNSLPPEGKVSHLEKGIEEVNQTVTEWVDTSHYGHEWVYDVSSQTYVETPVWIEEGYWHSYEKKVKMTVYKSSNGLMFEEGSLGSKDLEKWGAMLERSEEKSLQLVLANRFGFSEKRSKNISKLLTNIKKIQKRRSLTERDLKTLSLSLFGVPFTFLKDNYNEGPKRENLILKVAQFNETDPESIKNILRLTFSIWP